MLQGPLHLQTLLRPQRGLWPELAELKNSFVLYGGTALALQLGHRESIDYDFFCSQEFEPGTLRARFPLLRDVEVLQASPNILTVLKTGLGGEVKLSFFGGLNLRRVGVPITSADNGVRIASVLDLAGTKIKVLQDCAELKDYLDVVAILKHGVALTDAVRAAMTIYGENFNPMVSLKALTYFEGGDVKDLKPDARRLLETAVVSVDLQLLHPFPASLEPFDAIEGPARAGVRGPVSGRSI